MSQAGLTSAFWALGRGTGVVALVLLTVSVVLGIVARSGRRVPAVGRVGISDLHRTAALTGTGLVVAHLGSLLFDPYAQLRLVDLAVPFLAAYRPLWLGLGTLAVDVINGIAKVSGTDTIAGSTATMDQVFRNAVIHSGLPREAALLAAVRESSANPARALGLPDAGLVVGAAADLVVLEAQLTVTRVLLHGSWIT